ncbi:phage tail protein [Paenibacillus sp. SEL3]
MIRVDAKELAGMKKRYEKVKTQAKAAVSRAMNRVSSNARTNVKKEIAKEYVIKSGDVNKTLSTRKASASSTSSVVRSTSRGTGLDKYKFNPKRATGKRPKVLKAAVKKGGAVKGIKGAFVADKNGVKIFVREGKKRLPIRRLYGPPAPEMFNQQKVRTPVEQKARETFEERIMHELDRELKP